MRTQMYYPSSWAPIPVYPGVTGTNQHGIGLCQDYGYSWGLGMRMGRPPYGTGYINGTYQPHYARQSSCYPY